MARIILIGIFYFSFFIGGYGQDLYLKKIELTVPVIKFPIYGFDKNVVTYDMVFENEAYLANIKDFKIKPNEINDKIEIPNYLKVENMGDVTVMVEVKKLFFSPVELAFEPSFIMRTLVNSNLVIKLMNKDVLIKKFDNTFSDYYYSKEKGYTSKNNSVPNSKIDSFYIEAMEFALDAVIKKANVQLSKDYGYKYEDLNTALFTPDYSKKTDYSTLINYEKTIVEAYDKMEYESIDTFKVYASKLINFWKEKLNAAPTNEDPYLIFLYRYNIAMTAFWAEDFALSKEYADLIVKGDTRRNFAKDLLREIEDVELLYNKFGVNSRHFEFRRTAKQKSDFATSKALYEEVKTSHDHIKLPEFNTVMEVGPNSKVEKYRLKFKNGISQYGYVAYESAKNYPDFRTFFKMRFSFLKKNKLQAQIVNYSEIDSISVLDWDFKMINKEEENAIHKWSSIEKLVLLVNEYDRTKIFMYLPCCMDQYSYANATTKTKDFDVDYQVYNNETKTLFKTEGPKHYSKYLKNIVIGCPEAEKYVDELIEEASKLSFLDKLRSSLNLDKVKKALELYDACKQ